MKDLNEIKTRIINYINKLDLDKTEDIRLMQAMYGLITRDWDWLVANLGPSFEVEDLEDAASSYIRQELHSKDSE